MRDRDELDEGLGINLCLGVKMQFNLNLMCMFHLNGRDARCVFSGSSKGSLTLKRRLVLAPHCIALVPFVECHTKKMAQKCMGLALAMFFSHHWSNLVRSN